MGKNICIDLNDLVGNLFITLRQAGYVTNRVSYSLIDKYSDILSVYLKEKGIQPIFEFSRDNTRNFLLENSSMYRDVDGEYIELIGDYPYIELVDLYCGNLSMDILLTVLDKNVISETLIQYENELRDFKYGFSHNEFLIMSNIICAGSGYFNHLYSDISDEEREDMVFVEKCLYWSDKKINDASTNMMFLLLHYSLNDENETMLDDEFLCEKEKIIKDLSPHEKDVIRLFTRSLINTMGIYSEERIKERQLKRKK